MQGGVEFESAFLFKLEQTELLFLLISVLRNDFQEAKEQTLLFLDSDAFLSASMNKDALIKEQSKEQRFQTPHRGKEHIKTIFTRLIQRNNPCK